MEGLQQVQTMECAVVGGDSVHHLIQYQYSIYDMASDKSEIIEWQ